jgi:two-component system, NarL family, sensor histidine kinase YdfH
MQIEAEQNRFIALPLYIFTSVLIGGITLLASLALIETGETLGAVIIVVLAIAHIGCYWLHALVPSLFGRWGYYLIQTLVVLAIALITRVWYAVDISLFETAIICLICEALGWWGNSRKAFLIGGFYAALAVVVVLFANTQQKLTQELVGLLVNGGGFVLIMLLFNQQLFERQKAMDLAERLESANAKLAASAAKIETLTLQTERQRMARELHDTLAQGVAGITLQLEAVKAHLAAQRTERAATILDQALVRARRTLAQSRAAIDDLRVVSSDLHTMISERIEQFRQIAALPCTLELAIHQDQLAPETNLHLLYILNEALTNVSRHAAASHVHVRCQIDHDMLELQICDDGKGFDTQRVSGHHYGLLGMRERAALIGATLVIDSDGAGTCVRCQKVRL